MAINTEPQARARVRKIVQAVKADLAGKVVRYQYPQCRDALSEYLGIPVFDEALPLDLGDYIAAGEDQQYAAIRIGSEAGGDPDRINFTFFHEVGHRLVHEDDELYEFIDRLCCNDGDLETMVDHYCDLAAAEFLIPMEDVQRLMDAQGFTITLIEQMEATHPASKIAIAIQLAHCAAHPCYVLVCERGVACYSYHANKPKSSRPLTDNEVRFRIAYWASSYHHRVRYRLKRNWIIPDNHALRICYEEKDRVRVDAAIPSINEDNPWVTPCEAFYFKGRVYAAFNVDPPPIPPGLGQMSLFG